jgi:hypothetical protein
MPWYRMPLNVYLVADDPAAAQAAVLAMLPKAPDDENRPYVSGGYPQELDEDQVASWGRLRKILLQAERDTAAGDMVSDPRFPGVRFSPAAAAELAALEFERGLPGELDGP